MSRGQTVGRNAFTRRQREVSRTQVQQGENMSDIKPSVVPVVILLFDVDADSPSPVTLRVKPDRRRTQMPFPEALERRVATAAPRLTEIALVAARSK